MPRPSQSFGRVDATLGQKVRIILLNDALKTVESVPTPEGMTLKNGDIVMVQFIGNVPVVTGKFQKSDVYKYSRFEAEGEENIIDINIEIDSLPVNAMSPRKGAGSKLASGLQESHPRQEPPRYASPEDDIPSSVVITGGLTALYGDAEGEDRLNFMRIAANVAAKGGGSSLNSLLDALSREVVKNSSVMQKQNGTAEMEWQT